MKSLNSKEFGQVSLGKRPQKRKQEIPKLSPSPPILAIDYLSTCEKHNENNEYILLR